MPPGCQVVAAYPEPFRNRTGRRRRRVGRTKMSENPSRCPQTTSGERFQFESNNCHGNIFT